MKTTWKALAAVLAGALRKLVDAINCKPGIEVPYFYAQGVLAGYDKVVDEAERDAQ